jgi:hypothetical protein
LDLAPQAKAFSGTAVYTTTFTVDKIERGTHFSVNLGSVNMIAKVTLNGKFVGTVWCSPYRLDLTNAIVAG